jgi:hypothetical protein
VESTLKCSGQQFSKIMFTFYQNNSSKKKMSFHPTHREPQVYNKDEDMLWKHHGQKRADRAGNQQPCHR